MRIFHIFLKAQLLLSITLFINSCNKDKSAEYQAEYDQKFESLKQQLGMNESNLIEDNIYIKFDPVQLGDTFPGFGKPTINDLVIFDYVGSLSDGTILDISVEEVAKQKDIYEDDFIYGPGRFWVKYLFPGLQKAIQHMQPKSTATVLIPNTEWIAEYYEPLVYKLTLYNFFNDLEVYNNQQVARYLDSLGLSYTDTIPGYPQGDIWAKNFSGRTKSDLAFGDTVLISLHAYYAEADTTFMERIPGRQFYPISKSGDSVLFIYGEEFFPITPALNEAITFMEIGESVDLVANDNMGYSDVGFIHPYSGKYIVPPYTPLHYNIELLDTMKIEH